ncbi:hypothetical protein [Aquisphaera insulae]|uniref:hypothetical protein n=1 Tax=Aquisphaera insulae TaxID=2712864 RepID=UPI0013EDF3F2|nr:hypothetical protein [Aquisphaera insulae]
MSNLTPGFAWERALARLGVAILTAIIPVFGLTMILCSPFVPWLLPRSEVLPVWIRDGIVMATSVVVGYLLLRLAVRLTAWLAEGSSRDRTTSVHGRGGPGPSDPLWDPELDR